MEWDDKVEMVKFLNDGDYEKAVSFFSEKEVDPQAMDMFVTGFDLKYMMLLKPIKDLLIKFDSSKLDFRSGLRLELIKQYFLEEDLPNE